MKKKIEEGCLAIVVDGCYEITRKENVGKIVRIGKYLGKIEGYFSANRWEVNQPMAGSCTGLSIDDYCYHIPEKFLERIDENHTEHKQEELSEFWDWYKKFTILVGNLQKKRSKISETGKLYISVLTFKQLLQPILPSVDNPLE